MAETEILKTQICIVGAGPAGASLALFLEKEKINHIILDAASFPRDKICGDGLDLNSIAMLNHIDPSILEKELKDDGLFNPSWGFRLINPNGKTSEFTFVPEKGKEHQPPYAVTKRIDFDNLLINRFNPQFTTFLSETKATKFEKLDTGWKIEAQQKNKSINIYCNLLVGADGDRSFVLKYVAERNINKEHYGAGLRQYWEAVEGLHEKNLLEVFFPKNNLPLSYFWIFPLGKGMANVGYVMISSVVQKNNFNIKEIFNDLIQNNPALKGRFKNAKPLEPVKGWGLPLASSKRQCYGDGWILVGDAASFICPTTGEGIGTGMRTSFIASKFIRNAIEQNKFDATVFKNYDRELYKRMQGHINTFNITQFISPIMLGGWLKILFIL